MTSKERKEGRYQRRKADRLKNKYLVNPSVILKIKGAD